MNDKGRYHSCGSFIAPPYISTVKTRFSSRARAVSKLGAYVRVVIAVQRTGASLASKRPAISPSETDHQPRFSLLTRMALMGLARIIHIFEDNKSLLCYKHVN